MSVEGANFTDRVQETRRLKLDFENGMNVVLISPRRQGKTSLVKKVKSEIRDERIKVVYMDVYDCRSEYDFYNRFASEILKACPKKMEHVIDYIKKFLVRISPKISFSPEANSEFSLSLGITPKEYSPEEMLNLPEKIAQELGVRIVVCIDEFQQIGEFPDSITVQKRMRGVWQHQQNVSYCLFGSKKHLMTNLFQNRRMPFFQFGEMMFLEKISTADWVPFIMQKFALQKKEITAEFAEKICNAVDNQSSYVQQLAWNVMAVTDEVVDEAAFNAGVDALISQNSPFFYQQTQGLTTYQMNFLRALCSGISDGFMESAVKERFPMGTNANLSRIKATLLNKEIIEDEKGKTTLADAVFALWFRREMMQ